MKSLHNRSNEQRLTFPVPGITWGEEGLDELTYKGKLPFAAVGKVTHDRIVWSKAKPVRLVDVRDLPSILAAAGGKKMFDIKSELDAKASKKESKEEA